MELELAAGWACARSKHSIIPDCFRRHIRARSDAPPPCALLVVSCAGETEETALPRAEEVVAACVAVHNSVMQLFDGIDMPASNVWFWPGK